MHYNYSIQEDTMMLANSTQGFKFSDTELESPRTRKKSPLKPAHDAFAWYFQGYIAWE